MAEEILKNDAAEEAENPSRDVTRDGAGDAPVNGYSDNTPDEEPEGPSEEELEKEREAIRKALYGPYQEMGEAIREHDGLMADVLYEMTMIEIGMEE